MTLDISGITYFMPVFSFVLVFVVLFAILNKTKIIGENAFTQAITSFILAVIFASFSNVREYVENVTPWFVVIFIALFFIVVLCAFVFKDFYALLKPGLGWIFVIAIIITFLVVAYFSFDLACNPAFISFKRFIFRDRIAGSIWLVIFALVVGFVITRK